MKAARQRKTKIQKAKRTKKEITSSVSSLALFVRNRREELGYTQEELAFRAGVSSNFLKAFERGKQTVRLDKVKDLLNYFGAVLVVQAKGENG